MEEVIRKMGYAFRDLTYHTSGQYSCRLGYGYYKGIRGIKEFWGNTPMEAVQKAIDAFDSLEPKELL